VDTAFAAQPDNVAEQLRDLRPVAAVLDRDVGLFEQAKQRMQPDAPVRQLPGDRRCLIPDQQVTPVLDLGVQLPQVGEDFRDRLVLGAHHVPGTTRPERFKVEVGVRHPYPQLSSRVQRRTHHDAAGRRGFSLAGLAAGEGVAFHQRRRDRRPAQRPPERGSLEHIHRPALQQRIRSGALG
jgi:hypothetical protein